MGTKTISIMDDVYAGLVREKVKTESFSDELRRLLTTRKGKLSDCAGLWNWMSEDDVRAIKTAIHESRIYSTKERTRRL